MLRHKTLIGIAGIFFIFLTVITSFAGTLYTYDDNNRLIRESYDDGTVIIYVYDNIGNRLQKFTYTGSSQLPNISTTPTSNNFGSVNVGYKSSQKTFTVSNTGTGNLLIGSITISGSNPSDFKIQNDLCSGKTVVPSSSCTFQTVLKPISVGSKTASLSILSNDPDTPLSPVQLSGSGTANYTSVILITPNGGEKIPSGSMYAIKWGAPPEAVKFTLEYSLNNGSSWVLIASNVTGTSYEWKVPAPTANKTKCFVRVTGYNSSGVVVGSPDKSNSVFTIEVVKVVAPNGGEQLKSGSIYSITWEVNETSSPVSTVKVFYYDTTVAPPVWKPIATLTWNPGSYQWTVPVTTTAYTSKIKVALKNGTGSSLGSDVSNAYFNISP